MTIDDDTPRGKSRGDDGSLLDRAKDLFALAKEHEQENREEGARDLRFARLGDQWPEDVRKQREINKRPILTINKLAPFIRQVVNSARQSRPSIKVSPVDDHADVATADIMTGLIRNIEYSSDAEVAYDTAIENAVSCGWGYFKIDLDYPFADTFDLDIRIERIASTFSVYGDPYSKAADSSDWNCAFEAEWVSRDEFERQWPKAEAPANWAEADLKSEWVNGDDVLLVTFWERKEIKRKIMRLSDGRVISEEEAQTPVFGEMAAELGGLGDLTVLDILEAQGITVTDEREASSYEVSRHIMSGCEVLKSEPWPGIFIPIIPVYGDEIVDEDGKRIFRSLVNPSKDAQRSFNYWRTTAAELVALAPKAPWVGVKGSFSSDARNWASANTENHPYLEYDPVPGHQAPQRQPLDSGPAAGALQEAMNASDDIKAIIGIYDPALGNQSNEVSGVAISRRQERSDVTTFHFQDNLNRAIRHAGRILIDLIPKVYTKGRIIRVLGEDGGTKNVPLGRPVQEADDRGQAIERVYDFGLGKYDLTVSAGPGYLTRRQEAADQMMGLIQAFPQAASVMGDLLAKNLDWPGADEIAKRLHALLPPQLRGGLPPDVEQMIEQGKQTIAQQGAVIQELQGIISAMQLDRQIALEKLSLDRDDNRREWFESETDRITALGKLQHKDIGINVPDASASPYPDFDGLKQQADASLAQAKADRAWTEATSARARIAPAPQVASQQNPGPFPG